MFWGCCLTSTIMGFLFLQQAFNITSKATETLDTLLTDSVKCRMPANGLQLFGIRQIEESNMAKCKHCLLQFCFFLPTKLTIAIYILIMPC